MNLLDLAVKITCDDQASSKVEGIKSKISSGIGSAAKAGIAAIGAATAAVGTAVMVVGKQALDAYSNYEQLTGGVAKLFGAAGQSLEEYAAQEGKTVEEVQGEYDKLMSAQSTVMSNAANAYKTAGMSANDYMNQVTSFSAALISSLGGDTEAAAAQADKAITDMSDNANTFGSNIEDIQNAYQGFAKQNYTMLDNLKLGYGGTKEEMQRLLDDAGKLADTEFNIDSYSDVIEAIHVMQESMNIAGTTAREASTTIEGSINSAKAAYSNWLTGLADDDADMVDLTSKLVDSVATAAQNIVPRVMQITDALMQEVQTYLPQLLAYVSEQLPTFLQTLVSYASQIIQVILTSLPQITSSLLEALPSLINSIIDFLVSAIPQLIETGVGMFVSIVQELPTIIETIVSRLPEIITAIVQALAASIPQIIQAGIQLLVAIVGKLPTIINAIVASLPQIVSAIVQALLASMPQLMTAGYQLFLALIQNLPAIIVGIVGAVPSILAGIVGGIKDGIPQMIDAGYDLLLGLKDGIMNAVGNVISSVKDAVGNIIDAGKSVLGIASPSKVFKQIGDYTMQGLAEGIEGNSDLANTAMTDAMDSLESSASLNINVSSGARSHNVTGHNNIVSALSNMAVYLDKDKLIGYLMPDIDSELGRMKVVSDR